MELKPCPFCGCKDITAYKDPDSYVFLPRYKVICRKCSAQIYRGTVKEAAEAWNRRAEDGN